MTPFFYQIDVDYKSTLPGIRGRSMGDFFWKIGILGWIIAFFYNIDFDYGNTIS